LSNTNLTKRQGEDLVAPGGLAVPTPLVAPIVFIFSVNIIIYISTSLDIDKSYFLKIHPETDISGVCGEISETTEKICYISILV
jgi:hypothetical protein